MRWLMGDGQPRKSGTRKPAGARPNREGRPYRRASDGLWCQRVYPPKAGARPVYVYGKTLAIVRRKAKARAAGLAAGRPGGTGRTLGEFLEYWTKTLLPQQVRAGEISQGTADEYARQARLHVIPALGWMRLAEIDPPEIRAWLDQLLTKPSSRTRRKPVKGDSKLALPPVLSARSAAYCHTILRRAVNDAIRDRTWGITENPVQMVPAPRWEAQEMQPIAPAEARALLAAMAEDRLWCYWLVVFALGLRRGEGLGVRWPDVDLSVRTIRLRWQIRRQTIEDPETGRRPSRLVSAPLKTRGSAAPLALPQVAADALRQHQREQRIVRMKAAAWLDAGLVFCTGVGTALEPRDINRAWTALCERAGTRPVRLHDLRHACATYLVAAGVDIRTVQGTLRHAKLSTTMLYTHLLEEVQRDAADKMNEIITGLQQPRSRPRTGSDDG